MESSGEHVVIKEYRPSQVVRVAGELRTLYADVYAEPPYYETEADVTAFTARLTRQLQEPSFLLIAAWDEDCLMGYIYGFAIDRDSSLWAMVFLPLYPGQCVREWTYPVVFVSELLVAAKCRRRGIARALHDRFVAARTSPKRCSSPIRTRPQRSPRTGGGGGTGSGLAARSLTRPCMTP